ncbi:MAG: hypothetical protein IK083_07005 [Abditibacteriota bacterium]|nr:hypothetical protein [Abditibacteriota bacterium]
MNKSILIILLLCLCAYAGADGLQDKLSAAAKGDTVTIGVFEQDGNADNGAEPVEWIVVSKTQNSAVLLSKYALDVMAYDEQGTATSVDSASVSAWLKALSAGFTDQEKALTALLTLPGKDLASLCDSALLKCKPTALAKSKHPEADSATGCVSWWLADKGAAEGTTAYVTSLGRVQQKGISSKKADFAVRPCLILSENGTIDTLKTLARAAEDQNISRLLSGAEPGELVTFGVYEQDGNADNGPEPVEWYLVAKQDGKAYLISRYVLDWQPYDSTGNMVSWEEASIRKWLRSDFAGKAFESWEQDILSSAQVDASRTIYENGSDLRSLDGGQNTLDKVFLFSLAEVKDVPDYMRKASPTPFAMDQGAEAADGCAPWWLRSPRNPGSQADFVDLKGNVICGDTSLDNNVPKCGIRPAIEIPVAADNYDLAQEAFKNENWTAAFALFSQLGDQKDSRTMAHKSFENLLNKAETGDIVYFGSFEQDNDASNGKEAIEWYLLKFKDYVQLISVYGLEARPYSDSKNSGAWEDCSLRKYLNNEFLTSSFTLAEQDLISSWGIKNGKGKNNTSGGGDTEDKIIILSADEAKGVFTGDSTRKCFSTPDREKGETHPYWLRTPGSSKDKAAFVDAKGKINSTGSVITDDGYLVRPSLYIWMKGVEPSQTAKNGKKNDSGIKMPDIGGTIISSVISHIIGSIF